LIEGGSPARLVLDVREIDRHQYLVAVVGAGAGQTMALDDSPRGIGGNAKALSNLSVGELLDWHRTPFVRVMIT
jgi:hypothetical protein